MFYLKQSTATTVKVGPFIDDTDGKTPETSLTVTSMDVDIYKGTTKSDLTITASGGNNDMAHVANGFYSLELTAGNTDTVGRFRVTANISGALPVWSDYTILTAQVYDSLVAGSDALQVHANEITAGLITAAAIADNAIDGGALAATAVEKIADGVWEEPGYGHQLADPYTMGWLLHEAGSDWTELIADAVWDEALSAHDDAGSAGEALSGAGGGSTPSAIADAVWDEVMSGHATPGTAGAKLATASEGQLLDGSATAAANARAFFTSGYNAAASTIGTATAVTNHVLADLRKVGGATAGDYTAFVNMLKGVVSGTVVAGTNTTTVISTGLSAGATGFYVGKTLFVSGGARTGEGGRVVTAYDGATKRLTISPALTAALTPGDTIVLVG